MTRETWRRWFLASLLVAGSLRTARADEIVPPATLDPMGMATFIYRLAQPVTAAGSLAFDWTDTANRLVDHRDIPFDLAAATDIPLTIDMRRSVVMENTLTARLTPDAPAIQASFVAPAAVDPWSEWQTVLYQPRQAAQLAALRQAGVTGGMVLANRIDPAHPDPGLVANLVRHDLHWYVENIATDFYAEYHRWRPDRTETADFIEAKRLHQRSPSDPAAFVRVPSLSDPEWLARVRDRLRDTVQAFSHYQPLYYSLADEPGVADLAAAWDFDFSASSLTKFRDWLRTQYPSLGALNQEWGSDFRSWPEVAPATTDQAMARTDDNFAAWADFKAWMDVAFARALQAGTDAVHTADARARAAIEGAQIPGWGGYDYSRLATAVDLMEIYDFGQNVDIARGMNPGLVMISTMSGHDDASVHELWRSLLMGMRGVILWDDKDELANADGSLGETGRAIAPMLERLRDGLGALLVNSAPDPAPVAILYSPASFRTQWMLDQKPQGTAWAVRDAEAEYQDNAVRAATRGYTRLLAHLGLQGRFISPGMLTDGILARDGYRAVILPHVEAMSAAESDAIRSFAGSGGLVVADMVPGPFDEHSRRRSAPLLADLFVADQPGPGALFSLGTGPLSDASDGRDRALLAKLAGLLERAGVTSEIHLATADGQRAADVSIYRYGAGATRLYALQRDLPLQPGATAGAEIVSLDLPKSRIVHVLQGSFATDRVTPMTISLDPLTPTLLAVSGEPSAAPEVVLPETARLGQTVALRIRLPGQPRRAVFHVAAKDPSGTIDLRYSGNVLTSAGAATWLLPLAWNDPPGSWSIVVTDMLTDQTATATIAANGP